MDPRVLVWLIIEWAETHAIGLGVLLTIAGIAVMLWGMAYVAAGGP